MRNTFMMILRQARDERGTRAERISSPPMVSVSNHGASPWIKLFGLCLLMTACGTASHDAASLAPESAPMASATGDTPISSVGAATVAVQEHLGRYTTEVPAPPRNRAGRPRFDAKGYLTGVVGVPYNPCEEKPCAAAGQSGASPEASTFAVPWPGGAR